MNPGCSSPGWERRTAPGAAQTARPPPPLPPGWGQGEWGRFARVCLTLVNGSGIQLGKQTRRSLGAGRSGRRVEEEKRLFHHLRGPRFPPSRRGCRRFAQIRSGVPVGARRWRDRAGGPGGPSGPAATRRRHRPPPPTAHAPGCWRLSRPGASPNPPGPSRPVTAASLSSHPFRDPFRCPVGPHYYKELQPQDAITTTTTPHTYTHPGGAPLSSCRRLP